MPDEASQTKPQGLDTVKFQRFLERAQAGDEATLPLIGEIMDALSDRSRKFGGDLAYEAEQALIREYAKKNLWIKEALTRRMDQLRSELAGPNPTPLERLLVERVVLCWAHAYYADCEYAVSVNASREDREVAQRQQDRSQRRYLAAIKCLATVRRLALPIKLDVTVAASVETTASGTIPAAV